MKSVGLTESAFAVDGMFCGGCAATVERAVRRLPGVTDVNVSFLGDTAIVQHNQETIDETSIREAISRLGYTTRTVGEGQSGAQVGRFERQHRMRLGVALGFGMWVMMASMVRLFIDVPTQTLAWSIAVFSGLVSLPVLIYAGGPFLRLGWLGLRERVPGMDSLIFVATIAAVGGSLITLARGGSEVWFDVPVMLIIFQLLARLNDFGARRKAADAVRSMLDLSPVQARLLAADQSLSMVPLSALNVGDRILSHAGERIPSDARVVSGAAFVDNGLLTGESLPVEVGNGDTVFGGTLNLDGTLQLEVLASLGNRRMDVLASSVGRLLNSKSNLMKLADRVAYWLVPTLIAVALLLAVFMLATGSSFADAMERSLAVLVVSCPCALSLAIPLVVSVTAAKAAKMGIVLRDASALESADRIDTVLLDKTGTLTLGEPRVVDVMSIDGYSSQDVLKLAAQAGAGSHHPLMKAIQARYEDAPDSNLPKITDTDVNLRREFSGRGVSYHPDKGPRVLAGSRRWLMEQGLSAPSALIDPPSTQGSASEVCIAVDHHWVGCIYLKDELRADAAELIHALRLRGLTMMLVSGDRSSSVAAVAEQLDIEWRAEMSPEGKASLVEQLTDQGHRVAFVGDGLNDGPALAAASLGIATGKASDLARSAAAMAVLEGGLEQSVNALELTARASRVLRSNLVWAVLYNAVLLPAAVFGYVHPIMAVVAMGLSTASVSLNSLRAGRPLTSGIAWK